MAIVPNKGNPAWGVDVPYTTPNRSNAGAPTTANYAGEVVYDSTAKTCLVALGNPAAPSWSDYHYGWDMD